MELVSAVSHVDAAALTLVAAFLLMVVEVAVEMVVEDLQVILAFPLSLEQQRQQVVVVAVAWP